jgi:hypothetical protein
VSDENYRGVHANWAEPSVGAAAAWLVRLTDPALRRSIGEAAREHAVCRLGVAPFIRSITADAGCSAA